MDITHDLSGGILKTILKEGDGTDKPQKGSKVFVRYTGALSNGTVFEKSDDTAPFEFTIGEGDVIEGFQFAIPTMTCNETSSFIFHPDYTYGSKGYQQIIPPNTWLTFEIHLMKWLWKDISREKNGSITKQIIEPGVDSTIPSSISMVDIHLEKEQNGSVIEETDVKFRLGEGETYNISRNIEQALKTFNSEEKSRLFIHEKQNVWGKMDKDEVYVIKLNSFEKFKENWSLTNEGRVEQAKIFKEKGTKYFQRENYKLAHGFYKKMLDYLKNSKTEKQIEEIKSLTIKSYLNSALCHLKLYKYSQARDDCDNVLTIEPTNVKAMFRKGEALIGLYEAIPAKQCFEDILQYEPNNYAVKSKIQKCNEILNQHDKFVKSVYLNMFDKFAKKDDIDEKERSKQKENTSVMNSTLGYWGDYERERAPTPFELENPDIIILNPTKDFENM